MPRALHSPLRSASPRASLHHHQTFVVVHAVEDSRVKDPPLTQLYCSNMQFERDALCLWAACGKHRAQRPGSGRTDVQEREDTSPMGIIIPPLQ